MSSRESQVIKGAFDLGAMYYYKTSEGYFRSLAGTGNLPVSISKKTYYRARTAALTRPSVIDIRAAQRARTAVLPCAWCVIVEGAPLTSMITVRLFDGSYFARGCKEPFPTLEKAIGWARVASRLKYAKSKDRE
ncbi:hypothetical protein AGMMS50229_18590 [Campylobacterota bacterium]|nr:hypothetical protein AGMMS50229_18590 [Campylobacterota bacterium]